MLRVLIGTVVGSAIAFGSLYLTLHFASTRTTVRHRWPCDMVPKEFA